MQLRRIVRGLRYKGQITRAVRYLRYRRLLPGAKRGGHFDPSILRRRVRAQKRRRRGRGGF